jgi:hypothetical protein
VIFRGPLAGIIFAVIIVFGFLLALGDVLDLYDALWRYTVPATLVYAALIWIFALGPAKGQPKPRAAWPLGLDVILAKLGMTMAILIGSLGAIALVWDLIKLVGDHWHYIVLTLGVVALIVLFAMWPQKGKPDSGGSPRRTGKSDDIVS